MYCLLLICTPSGISLWNHPLCFFSFNAALPWHSSHKSALRQRIFLCGSTGIFFVSFQWQWPLTCSAPSLCSLAQSPCPWLCVGLPTGCLQGSGLPWMISQLRNNNVSLWQPELKLVWVGKECSWFFSNLLARAIIRFWMCSLLLLWAFDTWMWKLLLAWLSLASMMDTRKVCSVLISTHVLGRTSLIRDTTSVSVWVLQQSLRSQGGISPTSHFVPNTKSHLAQTLSGGETGDVLLHKLQTNGPSVGLYTWDLSIFPTALYTSCCFTTFKSNLDFFCFLIFPIVFKLCCFVSVLMCGIKTSALAAFLCPGCSDGLQPLWKLQMGVSLLPCFVLMGKQVCSCELRTNPLSLSSVFALEWLILHLRCELSKLWKNTSMSLLSGLLNRISE